MWSDDANENNYKDTILNSEMENFLSKLPLDREDLDLLLPLEGSEEDVADHNERLSLAEKARRYDEQVAKADDVSYMLESIQHRPHEETEELLMASLDLSNDILPLMERRRLSIFDLFIPEFSSKPLKEQENVTRLFWIILLSAIVLVSAVVIIVYGEISEVPMPPLQPIGAYKIVEAQEGESFFDYYNVYNGPDSKGSNGFNFYRNLQFARQHGMVKILSESFLKRSAAVNSSKCDNCGDTVAPSDNDNVVYIGSMQSDGEVPIDSVRLEGKRRFNRGLFIMDVWHMPTGCGTWPAFWLTDENNWPLNGEIDILEGVNYQTTAKTALHTTQGCSHFNLPQGLATGGWDTAIGVPDFKTGIPDMTMRYAKDCFIYNKHQWVNQGCVAVDLEKDHFGIPMNQKGGGIFVLEWDPVNRHIRSWVFLHSQAPQNLLDAIRTATNASVTPVDPDPRMWPLPYAYFAIGDDTDCPSSHFQNMHIVINLAFCGSVAGNRYFMDCPDQFKKYKTCEEWVKSKPEELKEAYWKIKGVYVYQREWARNWSEVKKTK